MSVSAGTIGFVHAKHVVDRVRELRAGGLTARDIATITGVPERTVSHWCAGDRRRQGAPDRSAVCARCSDSPLDRKAYSYLFGVYLGDGHITSGRRTECLWIYCSDDWPAIRQEIQTALRAVMPTSSVSVAQRAGCVAVKSFSRHWQCLFPQHGPGRKHTRPIVLEAWQQEVVTEHTGGFLRGLFHSDGCRMTNWATRPVAGEVKRYEYPRYFFSNESTDIMDLCAAALDRLGIAHTRPKGNTLSVARRAAVAALDEHVGPKS